MENREKTRYEARMEELLKDKEKIAAAIKNSQFFKEKNEAAAASLAKLPRPFPWEKEKYGEESEL